MSWHYTPFLLPVLSSVLVAGLLAVYARRQRPYPGAAPFAWMMGAIAVWAIGYGVELGGGSDALIALGLKITYIGATAVPLLWLWFTLDYTHWPLPVKRSYLLAVAVVPAITLLLAWSNEWHQLMWGEIRTEQWGPALIWRAVERGVWGWVHIIFSYSVMLLGTAVLLYAWYRHPPLGQREELATLLVSASFPWLGNVVHAAGLSPFDVTLPGFTAGGLLLGWTALRWGLFNYVPTAYRAAWSLMQEGIILLDTEHRILNLNEQARRMLGQPAERRLIWRPLTAIWPQIGPGLSSALANGGEMTLPANGRGRYYHLRSLPLHDQHRRLQGRLLVLRDVTRQTEMEQALRTQKQLFESLVSLAPQTTEPDALRQGLQHALTAVLSLTGASGGSIWLQDGDLLHAEAFGPLPLTEDPPPPAFHTAAFYNPRLVESVLGRGEPALIADIQRHNAWETAVSPPYPIRSALAVPLQDDSGEGLGVLSLHHPRPAHFQPAHRNLLQVTASQMVLVLNSARLARNQYTADNRQIITHKVLRAVGESLNPEEVAYIAVERVAELTGWPAVAISTPDAGGERLQIRAAIGALRIDEGVNGRAFRTGDTQQAPNPNFPTWESDYSALAVPLRRGRRRLGVFNVEANRPNAFSHDDILLAESLAEAIVLGLDNARLYSQMQQQMMEQRVLRQAGELIASTLDIPTVLDTIAEQMCLIMDVTSVRIGSYNPAQDRATVRATYLSPLATAAEQEAAQATALEVLPDTSELLASNQPRTISHTEWSLWQKAAPPAQTALVIPLQVGGQTMAYAELWEGRRPRAFSDEEKDLCQAIAQQAALAIDHARLFRAVAEEQSRLQALIKSDRDGIVMVGNDGRVLVINQPALDFLQINGRPRAWTHRSILELIGALRRQAPHLARLALAEMRRLQAGETAAQEGDAELENRSLNWRHLPVRQNGHTVGRLLVLRDITETRLLERMRDDLMHTMVHDLRGPLTSISISLHLLESTLDDAEERQHEMLSRAQTSMHRVLELVNAILDVNRLESGRLTLDRQPVALRGLVQSVVEWQLSRLDDKQINLALDINETLPSVSADEEMLGRVLQNLLDNAIKFTPPQGTITVRAQPLPAGTSADEAHEAEESQDRVCVSVIDTGPGIPADIRDRVFDKFTTGAAEEGGSGLGLYFCKIVLEAHGESIWVDDPTGEEDGTAFHFTLPLHTAVSPTE